MLLQTPPRKHSLFRGWFKIVLILVMICLIISIAVATWNMRKNQKVTTTEIGGPYGFTLYRTFNQTTVNYLRQMHVDWIRYQINWKDIEPEANKFQWRELDTAVALANANNIHISFPLQNAPDWALSQTCANRRFLPGTTEMSTFARIVAERYNNKNGHGYIDSYEVGNEEFDSLWTGNWDESIACRKPQFYDGMLKATYPVIKQVSPNALVGMNSIWWVNTPHITTFMQWLYQNGNKQFFDFANFHYYICNGDPLKTQQDRPSIPEEWQLIHNVMAQYHDASKPIWLTEMGWNTTGVQQDPNCIVSPQQQAQYLVAATQAAMDSHVIRHIFWYTIDAGSDGMSITQPGGGLPSFYALQDFIRRHPHWDF